MPIYEYKCSSCGHQQEFLQKVSDSPLTKCTACGQESFSKMVTAAGFHLKGSGWYATDFKGKGGAPAAKATGATPSSGSSGSGSSESGTSESGGKEASGPACGAGGCPACQ